MEGLSSRIRLVFLSYAGSESLVPVTSRRTGIQSGARVVPNIRPTYAQRTLKYAAVLVLLCMAGIGNVWGGTATLPNTQAPTTELANVGSDTNVKIKTSSANTYTNPLRFYASVTTTIQVASGYTIESVTYEASSTGNYVTYAQNATVSPSVTPTVSSKNVTWSFSSETTEFTFTPSSQTRANSITIKYSSVSGGSSCSDPATALSITSASVATVGTPLTLTTSGGNGGTITWSVTNGTGSATVSGSTLTPTGAGTITVKATQGEHTVSGTTYCGKEDTKTITISKAAATITLSEAGSTTDVSGTHYSGDSYTLPSSTSATCGTKVLVGWSTVTVAETDAKPTSNFYEKGAEVTLAAGENKFYAVFADEDKKEDELNNANTVNSSSNTYSEWTINSGDLESDAAYAGQSAGEHTSIQLRSNNNNSGIVTTTSGGRATKVVVEWNSSTSNGRSLDIYGKNTAYSAATDLYNNSNQGTKLGSIVYGTSTELTITGDYAYIGLRSSSGAMYISKITITWDNSTNYSTTCAACTADPTVGDASLNGPFDSNHIDVTCPSISAGSNCSINDYGFVWKAGSDPTISDNKTQVSTNNQSEAFEGTLNGTFSTGTIYYIKAYATNSHGTTLSATSLQVTPRSVTFDLNGHGSSAPSTQYVNDGEKASDPDYAEAVTGWDFGGWYKEPACTNAWDFALDVVSGGDVTLHAKWTKQNYTISSTLNHCTSSSAIPSSYEYTGSAAGLSYTISADEGYRLPTEITVSGTTYTWDSSTGALALTGTITSNVTITISAVQTHTVTWLSNGSNYGDPVVYDHGATLAFPASNPSAPSSCSGKVFVGWTADAEITTETSTEPTLITAGGAVNADATYRAVFADEEGSGETSTITLTNLQIKSGRNGTNNYSESYNIEGWTGKYAVNMAGTNYSLQIGRNTDTSKGAYNSHITTPTLPDGATITSITLTPYTGYASWKTESGRTFYLMNTNSLNYTAASNQSNDYGVGSCTSDNAAVTINTTNSPSQCHIYADGVTYLYSISLTYSTTSYNNYITQCCPTKVTLTASKTGSGTVTFGSSTIATCDADKEVTMTIAPGAGYQLTSFEVTTGDGQIAPKAMSDEVVTGNNSSAAQNITLTFAEDADGAYDVTATFTVMQDKYYDYMHANGLQYTKNGNYGTVPTLTNQSEASGEDCTTNHYKFKGWVAADEVNEDGSLKTGYTLIAGGTTGKSATNTSYYAVWAEEE